MRISNPHFAANKTTAEIRVIDAIMSVCGIFTSAANISKIKQGTLISNSVKKGANGFGLNKKTSYG